MFLTLAINLTSVPFFLQGHKKIKFESSWQIFRLTAKLRLGNRHLNINIKFCAVVAIYFAIIRSYCWFARDVTAAMLVVKNKTVSLRWELNSIFMQILRNKIVLY